MLNNAEIQSQSPGITLPDFLFRPGVKEEGVFLVSFAGCLLYLWSAIRITLTP